MFKRKRIIQVFYNTFQVLNQDSTSNYSKSPLKPKLLLEFIKKQRMSHAFNVRDDFQPFENEEFLLAHTPEYVHNFFSGTGNCSSNSLAWSEQFADSVRYTNASLYNSIRHALIYPQEICFSPTSGFHHAGPNGGSGFCTFSGQVIAATKLYRYYGVKGCFLDLDGHFGNSIEDSRNYVKDLNKSIPKGFNFNPRGHNSAYVNDLKNFLYNTLKPALLNGDIDYVVWCHGADSHVDDDLGHQCDTEHWLKCTKIFVKFIKEIDKLRGFPIPISMALFGGYRRDDYDSVLALHTADLAIILNSLCDRDINVKRLANMVKDKPKPKPVSSGIDWNRSRSSQIESSSPTHTWFFDDDEDEEPILIGEDMSGDTDVKYYTLTSKAYSTLMEPDSVTDELYESLNELEIYDRISESSLIELGYKDNDILFLEQEGYIMEYVEDLY